MKVTKTEFKKLLTESCKEILSKKKINEDINTNHTCPSCHSKNLTIIDKNESCNPCDYLGKKNGGTELRIENYYFCKECHAIFKEERIEIVSDENDSLLLHPAELDEVKMPIQSNTLGLIDTYLPEVFEDRIYHTDFKDDILTSDNTTEIIEILKEAIDNNFPEESDLDLYGIANFLIIDLCDYRSNPYVDIGTDQVSNFICNQLVSFYVRVLSDMPEYNYPDLKEKFTDILKEANISFQDKNTEDKFFNSIYDYINEKINKVKQAVNK